MNRYGALAEKHWKRWLPKRYSQLRDPKAHFEALGEEIANQVDELSQAIAGDDPPAEEYLQKLGRLNMARLSAEERVLREMALIDPEPDAPGAEDEREA